MDIPWKNLMYNTALYVGMLSPASGLAVLRQGDNVVKPYRIYLEFQP